MKRLVQKYVSPVVAILFNHRSRCNKCGCRLNKEALDKRLCPYEECPAKLN